MVEEEWSFIRHYTYNPAWRKGKEAFFATDGSDQSMIVLFAPEGCVINGVDSELYDWEDKLPRVEDLTNGMPPALQKLMSSREVKKMKAPSASGRKMESPGTAIPWTARTHPRICSP